MNTNNMLTHSKYVESVISPRSGPASIPDSILRKHHLRSEPITLNTQVTNGQGLYIIYPNSQDEIIGYSYVVKNERWTLDRELRTAQKLSDNYDFSRKISQSIRISSTTTAAGTFQLGGTFNGVTYEGPLSDVTLDYNSILSCTTDNYDRVENVPVHQGVTILTLPVNASVDYNRLNDTVQSAQVLQGECMMANNSDSVSLMIQSGDPNGGGSYGSITPGLHDPSTNNDFRVANFPIDLTPDQTFTINGWIEIWDKNHPSPSNEDYFTNVGAFIKLYNIAGEMVVFDEISLTTSDESPIISTTWSNPKAHAFRIPLTYHTNVRMMKIPGKKLLPDQPIVRGEITFGFYNNKAMELAQHSMIGISIASSKTCGPSSQVTVVMYEGASAGQTMTVSGHANFELIPNALLQKNIPLEYPYYNGPEFEYMQALLGNRHRLNLRTIYPTSEYENYLPLLQELARLNKHEIADAFDFADFIKLLKHRVLPGLGMIPGPVGRIFGGASDLWKSFDNMDYRTMAFELPGTTAQEDQWEEQGRIDDAEDAEMDHQYEVTITGTPRRATMFPVILVNEEAGHIKGGDLYAVTDDFDNTSDIVGITTDGFMVAGYRGLLNCKTGTPLTMHRIVSVTPTGFIATKKDQRSVAGSSLEVAVNVLIRLPKGAMPKIAFTGGVDNTRSGPIARPNPFYLLKDDVCKNFGVELAANDSRSPLPIKSIAILMRGLKDNTFVNRTRPAAFACDETVAWAADWGPGWSNSVNVMNWLRETQRVFHDKPEVMAIAQFIDSAKGTPLEFLVTGQNFGRSLYKHGDQPYPQAWPNNPAPPPPRPAPQPAAPPPGFTPGFKQSRRDAPIQDISGLGLVPAQYAKYLKKVERMQQVFGPRFPGGDTGVTIEWIKANGGEGPDQEQVKQLNKGILPEPRLNKAPSVPGKKVPFTVTPEMTEAARQMGVAPANKAEWYEVKPKYDKYVRLLADINRTHKNSPYTLKWLIGNGGKKPSPELANYVAIHGHLPSFGEEFAGPSGLQNQPPRPLPRTKFHQQQTESVPPNASDDFNFDEVSPLP